METTPGTRLRHLRELLGYKGQQQDFADKVGLTQQSISNMERNKTEPASKSLNKIQQAFPQVNINWLVSGQGQPLTGAQQPRPAASPIVAEPVAPYGCAAPDLAISLAAEVAELRAENKQLKDDLRQARKEAREDLIAQARVYNSVKQGDAELITNLYAFINRQQVKIDEYELTLGYRRPTAEERQQQEQNGSSAPRMEILPFGGRYRTPEPIEATECVVREMYPAAEVSHCEAA